MEIVHEVTTPEGKEALRKILCALEEKYGDSNKRKKKVRKKEQFDVEDIIEGINSARYKRSLRYHIDNVIIAIVDGIRDGIIYENPVLSFGVAGIIIIIVVGVAAMLVVALGGSQ